MTPPNDLDAERAVLGALMLGNSNPTDTAECYAALKPQSFYRSAHAAIFAACLTLYSAQIEIDELTVVDKLRSANELDLVGGQAEVVALTEATATSANLARHVAIVRDLWLRRQLIAAASEAARLAQDFETPVADLLDRVASGVSQIATTHVRGDQVSLAELMRAEFKRLSDAASGPDEPPGVPTGFVELDEKLGGLQRGNLVILAGRPSMGKSAAALEMARYAAVRGEVPVLVISLEMQRQEIAQRALSSQARVNGQGLRRPKKLDEADWSRIADAAGILDTSLLHVVDAPNLTVLDIRAQARLCKSRHGLGLLVVDYLGLIRAVRREQVREREVAEISGGLKALAKELDVPVLCLAQLNRGVESREQKRPRLSDLRESGSLEQDADVVLFVHREAYYSSKADDDVAEIIIAKQRNGPIGIVEVGWEARFSKFYNRRMA